MNSQGQYQLVFGDSSKMDILRTGEVDLVLTGPPYFSDATEELLREPFRKQKDIERAKQEVSAFAIGLRPVYEEIRRVLRPGGYLVTQTKDLCYGGIFISLTALHRELAEATGLHLLSHIYWHKFKRNSDSKRFLDTPSQAHSATTTSRIFAFSPTNRSIQSRTAWWNFRKRKFKNPYRRFG